jgi:hypothetical protein
MQAYITFTMKFKDKLMNLYYWNMQTQMLNLESRREGRGRPLIVRQNIKQAAKQTTGAGDTPEIPTRNFYAPLRSAGMELDQTEDTNTQTDGEEQQQPPNSQRGRPPPIKLTATVNSMQLQRQLKGIVNGSFESANTRNGTRIVTNEMADYSAIKEYLSSQTLNYFTFYPKSLKPIKAVIRHLTGNIPAEEIYEGFVELCFDIISVKKSLPPADHKVPHQQAFPYSL